MLCTFSSVAATLNSSITLETFSSNAVWMLLKAVYKAFTCESLSSEKNLVSDRLLENTVGTVTDIIDM